MRDRHRDPRIPIGTLRQAARGLTLVELLVVVAILGLLTVTVIPNIAGSLDRRRIRDAAGNLSGFAARAQSRGMSAADPRGFLIQPLATNTAAAIDFYFADTPAAYAGDLTSSRAIVSNVNMSGSTADVTFTDLSTTSTVAALSFCRPGDSIQFGGHGPYFHFDPTNLATTGVATVKMLDALSQSPYNTRFPPPGPLPFRIRRQPTRASTGILQIENNAAVDLYWSAIGSDLLSNKITAATQPIIILYDVAGRPEQIVHSGGTRGRIVAPVYLLVGLAELCGNAWDPAVTAAGSTANQENRTGANWQYADSYWVVIDNKTGLTRTAPVTASVACNAAANALSTGSTPAQAAAIGMRFSQGAIRSAVGVSAVE